MRVTCRLAATFALTLLGPILTPGLASAAEVVPGEVVVRFAKGTASGTQTRALAAAGAERSAAIGLPATRVVRLEDGVSTAGAVAVLERRPDVLWAEPNYVMRATVAPNDPGFPRLWGLANGGQTLPQAIAPGDNGSRAGIPGIDVGAERAWERTTGTAQTLVGVVDTGVAQHEDLDGNLRTDLSRDFRDPFDGAGDPTADANGHGTHVAGTIGAVGNNGVGVAGVNWTTGLVGLRALDQGGGTSADVAAAFAYAGQLGLPIVNASLGGPGASLAVSDAIRLAPGTLFVVAAGNDTEDVDTSFSYPCRLPWDNIVCVAAIGNLGDLSWFSNWGAETVDLGAPGSQILSTVPTYANVHELPIDVADFAGDWTTGGIGPAWDVVAEPGGDELVSQAAGDVQPGTDSWVMSEPFDLDDRRGCSLAVTAQLGLGGVEDGVARVLVERTFDGASWTQIGELRTTDGWEDSSFALQADGLEDVRVRLRLVSRDDAPPGLPGAQISSLVASCLDDTRDDAYALFNGTSMATPHVAGAAALLKAARPGLTTAQLRDALLSTVAPLPALAGRTVTGGRLDLAAAMAAVTPQPRPPAPQPVPAPAPAPVGGGGPAPVQRQAVAPGRVRGSMLLGARGLLRNRVVVARVSVGSAAAVRATGRVAWGRGSARLVGVARATVRPGAITTLRLKLSERGLRRVERARAAGRALTVVVQVRIAPKGDEQPRTITRRVRLG